MEATVQLNVRMGGSLKESGDEALALIGLSPSQAVRALWEKASRRGEDLEEVAALLADRQLHDKAQQSDYDEALNESWNLVESTMSAHGLTYDRPEIMLSDEDLLEEVLYSRLVERGLI